MRHWLDTLQNAEKIISTPDFSKIKPFLEMIGTNRYLQDKKVGIDLVAPYSFIPTYKGLQDINKIEGINSKTGEVVKNERLPAWMSTKSANHKLSRLVGLPVRQRQAGVLAFVVAF